MKIHYQTYEAIDKVEVLQMMEDFSALDNYTFNSDQREKSLLDFTAHDAFGKLYVIKKELETIGYIVLTFGYSFGYNGRDAFIDEFYIKEAFRNKGIGKKTSDKLFKHFKSIKKIKAATGEELQGVVTKKQAAAIVAHFEHQKK